jgi:rhodanese-related sulfurtransferase
VSPSDHGHIPGALGIPRDQLPELPADAQVVAYCRDAYCVIAHDAVRLLHAWCRHAARLADGMLKWRLAGLPVDRDPPAELAAPILRHDRPGGLMREYRQAA